MNNRNALSSPSLSSMQGASPFDVYVIATVDVKESEAELRYFHLVLKVK
jgi:hypothetical protein